MNPPAKQAADEALPERPRLPVFVSADGRRDRALRLVVRVVAGLTALWLAALVAGAIGLGRLPGLPLPQVGPGHGSAAPTAPHSASSTEDAQGKGSSSSTGERGGEAKQRSHHGGSRSGADGGHSGTVPGRRGTSGGAGTSRPATPHRTSRPTTPHRTSRPTTPHRSAPGAPSAPGLTTSPGRSGTAPGTTQRDSHDPASPPERTINPGATRAEPSPSATEHSPRWSATGG
jgi:hypothetical protein